MLPLAAVLAIAFAAVPAVVYRARRVPTPRGSLLRWGLVASGAMFFGLHYVGREHGVAAQLAVFGVATGALVASTVLRTRTYFRRDRLASALGTPEAPKALGEIDALVAFWWRRAGKRAAEAVPWTLKFAERAIVTGHPERALAWLGAIPPLELPAHLRAVAAQYKTSAHLRLGDLDAARAALASAPRPGPTPDFEDGLSALGALLDVLGGDATAGARAEAALGRSPAPTGAAQLTWQIVRAHAVAAEHAEDEARAVLKEVRAEHGDEPLGRVVAHRGPASPIAASLLAAEGPYR